MAEVDTAAAITFSTSTAVTITVGAATESDTATQVFNPLYAVWIDDPIVLSGEPVSGSRIDFTIQTPAAGSTATVSTSINNGASWDLATSGKPIPRLNVGDTVTRQVLTRAVLTRLNAADATPRVFVDARVTLDDSVDELVAVAHGPITSVAPAVGTSSVSSGGGQGVTATSGGGQIGSGRYLKIKGTDPSKSISVNPWEKPKVVNSQPFDQAITGMVVDRLPTQEDFSVVSANRDCDLLVYGLDQSSDAWQDIRDLATACGFEAYFDAAGTLVFRPVTDPRTARPVWAFTDGDTCTVTHAERELTADQTYNYIVVKGESTSTQNAVSAIAFDNDPASPTYVYGRFGRHFPGPITIPSVTTADQAQQAANAILYASLGASETTTVTTVPIPFLEVGDCVTVSIGDVKADGRYVINQMTTPLSASGAQTLTCFRQSSQES